MSEIGNIYARYGEALEEGIGDYEESRQKALEAIRSIYDPFIIDLICNFSKLVEENPSRKAEILRIFREQFNDGNPEVSFVAIDGTCGKEDLSEVMVFYAASYAQNGILNVGDDKGRLSYSRWTPSEDTSFVAYLPVPLNALSELQDEDWLFQADDEDRSSTAMIHTGLMQLAEIYLAYKRVTSEDRPPRIVLLDHSPSSILLSSDVMHLVGSPQSDKQRLGWIGAYIPRWGRTFESADALVAHAHPMNRDLGVPSLRSNALAERLVAEITDFWQIGMTGERDSGRSLLLSEISPTNMTQGELRNRINTASSEYDAFILDEEQIKPIHGRRRTLRQRWYDLRLLFEDTCERLFRERRLDALKLNYPESSVRSGTKWMDDNDIRFLVGVGLRLLIEICWQKKVLLIGIVKDSGSRYLFKNFLSVMDAKEMLNVPRESRIVGTDRTVCEMLPLIDEKLSAPWSTIEFDAVFMTLRALFDPVEQKPRIQGVRGDILVPSDGLFLRSLTHLFLQRRSDKASPLMGHVLFMDRIAYPYFDSQSRFSESISVRGSSIKPMIRFTNQERNDAQEIAVVITDFLTRNLFPEAIGQPDPLHRADLGAKALGKNIQQLIRSSIERFRQNPLAWSFRDVRDRGIL